MAFGSLPSVLGSGGGTAYSLIGGTGLFADGTAAAPSISFAADSNTGFFNVSSGNVGFSADGAVSLYFGAGGVIQAAGFTGYLALPSSGAINFFAGGSNRNITLTPSGTGMIDGVFASNGISGIRVSNTNGGASAYAVGYFGTTATPTDVVIGCVGTGNSAYGGANSGFVGTNGNKAFAFLTNGAEVARFHANGRLGLGTGATDSGALLQVGANAATGYATAGMSFGGDSYLYRSAAGTLTIQGATNTILQFAEGASASVRIQQSSGACYIDTQSAQPIVLRTNNTTALTLDASQRTILSGALRLNNAYVAGAVVGTGYVTIQDSTGTTYRIPVLV
jgi:hypothetical protein